MSQAQLRTHGAGMPQRGYTSGVVAMPAGNMSGLSGNGGKFGRGIGRLAVARGQPLVVVVMEYGCVWRGGYAGIPERHRFMFETIGQGEEPAVAARTPAFQDNSPACAVICVDSVRGHRVAVRLRDWGGFLAMVGGRSCCRRSAMCVRRRSGGRRFGGAAAFLRVCGNRDRCFPLFPAAAGMVGPAFQRAAVDVAIPRAFSGDGMGKPRRGKSQRCQR